eukprot:15389457-Alexandrium_andersonii.AAC.1
MRETRRAKRGTSCAWTCGMEVSGYHRFGTTEKAAWPVGRAGTATPSGSIMGPELTLTSHYSGPL